MKPAFLTLALLTAVPTLAQAETSCMPVQEMEAGLVDWYGETPVEGTQDGTTQIWASEVTGTWTLVSYLVDGNACTVAQGDNWADHRTDELLLAALSE